MPRHGRGAATLARHPHGDGAGSSTELDVAFLRLIESASRPALPAAGGRGFGPLGRTSATVVTPAPAGPAHAATVTRTELVLAGRRVLRLVPA